MQHFSNNETYSGWHNLTFTTTAVFRISSHETMTTYFSDRMWGLNLTSRELFLDTVILGFQSYPAAMKQHVSSSYNSSVLTLLKNMSRTHLFPSKTESSEFWNLGSLTFNQVKKSVSSQILICDLPLNRIIQRK